MTLLNKVLLAIEEQTFEVVFVGRHDWDGECVWEDDLVRISIYAPKPVSVLIHETIHWLYPRMKEEGVLLFEDYPYSILSEEQKKQVEEILWKAMRKYRKTHPKTAHRTKKWRER